MIKATFTGNITHVDLVQYEDREFLSVTVAVDDGNDNSIRVQITTSNGLMSAHKNGEDLTGLRVVVNGDIQLNSIRSHYTQDDVHKTLKYPQFKVLYASIERTSPPKQPVSQEIEREVVVA